jgi:hypothetical protein
MRLTILVISTLIISACGGGTPRCTDKAIVAQIAQYAEEAITNGLLKNDPDIDAPAMVYEMNLELADITTTEHDKSIDKHSCSANILVTLPPGAAALKDSRVVQTSALAKLDIRVDGDDIVTPVTYSTYRSEKDNQLIVHSENENIPAKFVQRVHKIGAFDSGQRPLPDLRRGPALYGKREMTVLIEPATKGSLQFQVDYLTRPMCRSWMQTMTGERDSKMFYENPEAGCLLSFSRLGEILLVDREGCHDMPQPCHPDGAYRKQ